MLNSDSAAAFVAFADFENFTRAAEHLSVAQPSLHAKIRKLERTVGRSLYEREGRYVHLTADGERLATFCREWLLTASEFLSDFGDDPRAPITVAAGEGALLHVIGDKLAPFLGREDAPLNLVTADRPTCVDLVRRGIAHVGITTLTHPPTGLEAEALATYDILAVTKQEMWNTPTISISSLAEQELVGPPQGRPMRTALDQAFAAAGAVPNIITEASGWPLLLDLVRKGAGVGIVNGSVKIPRGLKTHVIEDLPPVTYWLLYRTASIQLDRVERLLDALRAA